MHLSLGYISRHVNGKDVEPDDEALIFIEDAEPDGDGDASIHIRCKGAKRVAEHIIRATRLVK